MLEKPRIFTAESIAGIVQEATHDLQRKQTVKITKNQIVAWIVRGMTWLSGYHFWRNIIISRPRHIFITRISQQEEGKYRWMSPNFHIKIDFVTFTRQF